MYKENSFICGETLFEFAFQFDDSKRGLNIVKMMSLFIFACNYGAVQTADKQLIKFRSFYDFSINISIQNRKFAVSKTKKLTASESSTNGSEVS